MTKIENCKYCIAEAFRDCFYVVPDYQREYVWTEKEVEQLLEDTDEQIDSGKGREYFIGTVLVSAADPEQKNRFEVIDAQHVPLSVEWLIARPSESPSTGMAF